MGKKAIFKMPDSIVHDETRKLIGGLARQLSARDMLSLSDVPQIHRMATAYDMYLTCVDTISREGPTMKNLKGETVKRPEVNILRESWSQYLELAKEYGLTAKSKGQIKALSPDDEESPLDAFLKGRKESR